jgi:hypothetical protein
MTSDFEVMPFLWRGRRTAPGRFSSKDAPHSLKVDRFSLKAGQQSRKDDLHFPMVDLHLPITGLHLSRYDLHRPGSGLLSPNVSLQRAGSSFISGRSGLHPAGSSFQSAGSGPIPAKGTSLSGRERPLFRVFTPRCAFLWAEGGKAISRQLSALSREPGEKRLRSAGKIGCPPMEKPVGRGL